MVAVELLREALPAALYLVVAFGTFRLTRSSTRSSLRSQELDSIAPPTLSPESPQL